jgi:hypothetical protein
MGQLCEQHGFYSDAEYLLECAQAGQKELLGDEHSSTLDTIHSLASVFNQRGWYEKALERYGRALDSKERSLARTIPPPSTLSTTWPSYFSIEG